MGLFTGYTLGYTYMHALGSLPQWLHTCDHIGHFVIFMVVIFIYKPKLTGKIIYNNILHINFTLLA